jgi:hypothetical protein
MKRDLSALISIFFLLTFTGCFAVVAGTGIGAGAFAYKDGELERAYQFPFDRTLQACEAALSDTRLTVSERSSTGITARIEAVRSDGTEVILQIQTIAADITRVSVRTGPFGIWEKTYSERIHASIAQYLQG